MASVSGSEGGSRSKGRKGMDVDLNLVPFIDLLSMCICFLLMTAVWVQVGSVQVKQSHGTEAAANSKAQTELKVQLQSPRQVAIEVQKAGRTVKQVPVTVADASELSSKLDAVVAGLVKDLGAVPSAALIHPKSGTSYGDLVGVMDVLRKNQVVNLGVVAARSGT